MYKNIALTAPSLIQLARAIPSSHVVVDRPPESLARGLYVWPAWGVVLLATTVVVLSVLLWLLPVLRRRRTKPEPNAPKTSTHSGSSAS